MKRITFICSGNTCRSPMAEVILKNKIKNTGFKGFKVTSAGIATYGGDKISENSALALKSLGYSVKNFKSKRATALLLLESDLILCMTTEQKKHIKCYPNVYSLAEFTGGSDVLDPYGMGLNEYIKVSHQIEDACNIIIEKLIEQGERK